MTSDNDGDISFEDELNRYEKLIPCLVRVSDLSGGVYTTTRGIEGTKIYTKLVLSAMTIGAILPNNCVNHSTLWDFPSVAILARSLIETVHRYFYLTDQSISEDESKFRQGLYYYRINYEKYRLYRVKDDPQVMREFEVSLPKSKQELMDSETYKGLNKRMAQSVRSGLTDMHLSDAQIAQRNNLISRHFEFYYRLLSNHTHGSPFSTTSQSNTRGRGFKNETEYLYLALFTRLLNRYLSKTLLAQVGFLSLEKKCASAVTYANLVVSKSEI